MKEGLIELYVKIFGRPLFIKINKFIFIITVRAMGMLNYKNSAVSGERFFLNEYLKGKSGVVIDVGANVGNYSDEILSINDTLKIFAFEPHPLTFKKLQNKFSNNSRIKVINKGLSSSSGELELFDYQDGDGSSHASLFKEVITELHGSTNTVSHKVNLDTLDNFLETEKISEILLLKIDTEGNELEVLKGAKKIIADGNVLAIHFEFNEMNVVSRIFFKDFWDILDESKYIFYRLLPTGMCEIKTYNPLMCEIMAYQNIVAIKKSDNII
jgi:FkbM family methyltransferase